MSRGSFPLAKRPLNDRIPIPPCTLFTARFWPSFSRSRSRTGLSRCSATASIGKVYRSASANFRHTCARFPKTQPSGSTPFQSEKCSRSAESTAAPPAAIRLPRARLHNNSHRAKACAHALRRR